MVFSPTQIFFLAFLLFVLSRAYLRFREGKLSPMGFLFWGGIFGSAIILVLFPILTSKIAQLIGVGRGTDVVIYTSVLLLFYLVFRLYIFLEKIKEDITELVKKLALKELEKNEKKSAKD